MSGVEWVCLRGEPHLVSVLRRMILDDALHFVSGHRLEYVQLQIESPHFRLYHGDALIGIVQVRSIENIHSVCQLLAHFLIRLPLPVERVGYEDCGAMSTQEANAKVHRLPQLFSVPNKKKKRKVRQNVKHKQGKVKKSFALNPSP